MGRQVDLDSPLSADDKQYLRDRGRGYLIPANERRFGEDGTRTPEDHESVGVTAQSLFYDNQERDKAVYDVGGAPLPGVVLDHDSGRAYDRENGVTVEFSGPGHTPGGYSLEGFNEQALDEQGRPVDDNFDEDITSYVVDLDLGELRAELKEHGINFSNAAKLDNLRDKLVVFYQDLRNSGVVVEFADADEDEDETTETTDGESTEVEETKE
jgi:hypothetical protein